MEESMALVRAIVSGERPKVLKILTASLNLAREAAVVGASRRTASGYFFPEIKHYIYSGDTALHMAAAAFRVDPARLLIDKGSCLRGQESTRR